MVVLHFACPSPGPLSSSLRHSLNFPHWVGFRLPLATPSASCFLSPASSKPPIPWPILILFLRHLSCLPALFFVCVFFPPLSLNYQRQLIKTKSGKKCKHKAIPAMPSAPLQHQQQQQLIPIPTRKTPCTHRTICWFWQFSAFNQINLWQQFHLHTENYFAEKANFFYIEMGEILALDYRRLEIIDQSSFQLLEMTKAKDVSASITFKIRELESYWIIRSSMT